MYLESRDKRGGDAIRYEVDDAVVDECPHSSSYEVGKHRMIYDYRGIAI